MAISGDRFCTSAWNGFIIELRHISKFCLSQTIGAFLVFVGILLISLVSTCIFYLMIMGTKGNLNLPDFISKIDKTIVISDAQGLAAFFFVSSYAISKFILGLVDDAILCTLQCVAIDMDLNNGVPKFGSASFQESIKQILQREEDEEKADPYSQEAIAKVGEEAEAETEDSEKPGDFEDGKKENKKVTKALEWLNEKTS